MDEKTFPDPEALESDALKKVSSINPFFRDQRRREAAEMLLKASNLYKMTKRYEDCARCMISAANLYEQAGDDFEASHIYIDAARLVKVKQNDKRTVMMLYQKHLELGEARSLGEIYSEIGEYLKVMGDYDKAIYYFVEAIDHLVANGRKYSVNKCYDNLCRMYIHTNKFDQAGEALIKMAENIKIKRDTFILTAIMSFALHDTVYAKEVLDNNIDVLNHTDAKFLQECIMFTASRDCESLKQLFSEYNFRFKVKQEHNKIVNEFRKLFSQTGENNTVEIDEEDLT